MGFRFQMISIFMEHTIIRCMALFISACFKILGPQLSIAFLLSFENFLCTDKKYDEIYLNMGRVKMPFPF